MITKVNQFFGGDESTFPKVARIAGSKTRIVEIQKGQRVDIREKLGISDDMDLEEMQELSRNQEIWVVTEPVVRNVVTAGSPLVTAASVVATDADGNDRTTDAGDVLYSVPDYTVHVVSYVANDEQDALANELDLTEQKLFVERLEFGLADKTQNILKKAQAASQDRAAKAAEEKAARQKANAERLTAIKARLSGRPAAPVVIEPQIGTVPGTNTLANAAASVVETKEPAIVVEP